MDRVITVTGEIPADQLGRVLVHEHVFCALPGADLDSRLRLDEETVVKQGVSWLRAVAQFGVRTVVDATPITWYRRPDLLRRISEEAEVYIVASTGMYTEQMGWPFHLKRLTTVELAEVFHHEIVHGMLHTGVRAGIIKLATGGPALGKYERRAFDAAVSVQRATGVGIITHTTGPDGAYAQLDAFRESDANLDRILIGHVDNTADTRYHLKIIDRGGQIGFDRIGHTDFIDDQLRLEAIIRVLESGYSHRIMLSHDAVATYMGEFFRPMESPRWREFGFTFLFRQVLPALRRAGVTEDTIDTILTKNPRRLLAPS